MKNQSLSLGLAILALGSISFAQATKPQGKPTPKPTATEAVDQQVHVYKLAHIVGLELSNDAKKSVGEINDVVIDASTGKLVYAVVGQGGALGVGEKQHLVPWESLRFMRKDSASTECVASTTLSADQIASSPEYKKGEPIAGAVGSRTNPTTDKGTVAEPANARLVSADELTGTKLQASDKSEYGEIEDVVIAPEQGCVAYTVLASGGVLGLGEKRIAMPWKATEVSRDPNDKQALVARTVATKAQLEKAPEFVSNDWNKMASREWMTDLCAYYSAEPFWNHARAASAPKAP